jgi:hypothetical protein
VQGPDEPGDHNPAAIAGRLRGAALAAAAGALVAASSAHAGSLTALPSPYFPVRPTPPLRAFQATAEIRFPGRLTSNQVVRVSIDSTGRPFRVVDVNRIIVARKGDYSFGIAAPAEDVRAEPSSASEPGLRTGAVLWQGFSPGRRVLAAEITLRPAAAVAGLPLRVEISGSKVRLVNTTSASAAATDAAIPAGEIAKALDGTRASLQTGAPSAPTVLNAVGPVRRVHVVARVPLRVRGIARFGGGSPRPVDTVVGKNPVTVSGAGELKRLELSVLVPEPAELLRPPGASTWVALARAGRFPRGRGATRLAVERLLATALVLQFQEFLANPDAGGASRSSYRYLLTERPQPAVAESARPPGGHGWPVTLAVALGLAAALAGALVLWAHS